MAKINSKGKGNTFERKVSKILSEQFRPHTGLETSFVRNRDSGSFFGGKNVARTNTHDLSKATFGDLVCPDNFLFTVECKHYKSPPTFSSLLKQDNKTIDEWLGQAEQDAEAAGKQSLVIAKFNNVPEIAFLKNPLVKDKSVFRYKEYSVILLTDLLDMPVDFFFSM